MKPTTVYLSIPTLNALHPAFAHEIYMHIVHAGQHKIGVDIRYTIGDSVIMRARSEAISDFFFNTGHEYYCHVSDDIEIVSPTPDENLFHTLIAHKQPFVGALYSRTTFPEQCTSVALDGSAVVGGNRGLVPVKYLSGGIWLLHRIVIRQLMQAHPELEYRTDPGKQRAFALFLEMLTRRPDGSMKLLTEDYAFCQRWRDLGQDIYADTSIVTRHWGPHGYIVPSQVKGKDATP